MKIRKPLSVRNNNPLNIRKNKNFKWVGEVSESGGFVVFDSVENGFRAAYRTLQTYKNHYDINTLESIINRWAPEVENDTQSYIDFVEDETGLSREMKVKSTEEYVKIMMAMADFEGKNNYTIEQVIKGAALV